jgi:chromosome segregation ATPase
MHKKFEEARADIENLHAEIEQYKRTLQVKDETIEKLEKSISFFNAESKKAAVSFCLTLGWKAT